ncbi:coiled-coil domain-containing protein 148-like [Acropora millepora]|uniref:coiled-coil domain-containing protein 148-like n=1 Tax=Acropora millepora TaxID=45264 RepID=UPI001CF11B4E|nr:coiled-coil domain-containing protein 148-like [Acropora millepora]
MSGRDLRKFVNFHRTAIGAADSSLVNRFVEGQGSNRYRPADYDKLQAIAQLRKAAGNKTFQKIEKITKASKAKKVQGLLQQHKACWTKERIRLHSLQRKLQSDIDALRPGSPLDSSSVKEFFQDLKIYEEIISEDFQEFNKNTVQPLWDLREDLQFWIAENRDKILMGVAEKEHAEVLKIVESVKMQQHLVLEKLQIEQDQLEQELDSMGVHEMMKDMMMSGTIKQTGIPDEAHELECPDEQLKASVLEEFILLDKKFETQLEYLDLKYQHVKQSSSGGWSKQNHLHFVHLMEQYPPELPNRRMLYIDRMLREMPHKTRSELVEHEQWYLSHKFYQNQIHSTLKAWARDRDDMLVKVKATFAEAWTVYEEATEKAKTRKKQENICQDLYKKVLAFREEKLEALKLQAAIAAKEQEEEEHRLRAAEEKERKRRDLQRRQIQDFKEQKEREWQISVEQERIRLAELSERMAQQAVLDQQRVKYREEQLQLRLEANRKAKELAEEQEMEKQRRLDKLRQQVQVHIEDDPERIFKTTEASQARVASIYEEELELQHPLFDIHGYDEKKITSDRRLRVEKALRDAGMHNSDYARRIMASIQPPQQPRKDQHSTLFKSD